MQSRKSDKLEHIIPNWINEISKINSLLINKSKNFIDHVENILKLDGNKDEKVFLADSLETAIYNLENNVLNKLYDIYEDIYGNELNENIVIKEILEEINHSHEILESAFISVKNFLKTIPIADKNAGILNQFIQDVNDKVNNFSSFVTDYLSKSEKINSYLEEQKKISSKLDVV